MLIVKDFRVAVSVFKYRAEKTVASRDEIVRLRLELFYFSRSNALNLSIGFLDNFAFFPSNGYLSLHFSVI